MVSCVKAILLAVPLAAMTSVAACTVGTRFGLVSEGLGCMYSFIGSCLASPIVVAAAVGSWQRRAWRPAWAAVVGLAFATSLLSTFGIGQVLLASEVRTLLHPAQATKNLQVLRIRSVMFAGYMHVRCTKAFCEEVIKGKALVEVTEDMEPQADMTPWSARRSTSTMWDWWRPASMPGARFYFRHHKPHASQGWGEVVWTNEDMTEMYVFIRG